MNRYSIAPLLALFACGCTFTSQENVIQGEFHPPLVNHYWQLEKGHLADGTRGCALSSGYNGVDVNILLQAGLQNVSVISNRRIQPGATLTVNVNGNRYETYETAFPKASARALVQDFAKGGKAYLEWSEFSGTSGPERSHIQNIVRLDDFAAQLKECRDSLR